MPRQYSQPISAASSPAFQNFRPTSESVPPPNANLRLGEPTKGLPVHLHPLVTLILLSQRNLDRLMPDHRILLLSYFVPL